MDWIYSQIQKIWMQTHHLQEGKIADSHIVKVDLHFCPVELGVVHGEAVRFVVDHRDAVDEARPVHAFPKFASKQVDPHDAEDEPEDQTHQQHVHDGGDGSDQGVHDHLTGRRKVVPEHFSPVQSKYTAIQLISNSVFLYNKKG